MKNGRICEKMMANAKTLLEDLVSIFYPRLCPLCKRTLVHNECICLHCLYKIPLTDYHLSDGNPAAERFWGKIPCQKVSSFLYYSKGGMTREIIAGIKYKGNIRLGVWMGEWMAKEMLSSGFFDGIDVIVPVPLHKRKQKQRGYNQAEEIARGIGSVCHIPMNPDCLFRKTGNSSQTKKNLFERWLNTYDIFEVRDPGFFENKHVLIVDDVLTTGSTLEACAHAILKKSNARISILTLAVAL